MTPPGPQAALPAWARYLAASAHLSFWIAFGVFLVLEPFVTLPPEPFPGWDVPMGLIFVIGGCLLPSCMALLAVRTSTVGRFLRAHGARALLAHTAGGGSSLMLAWFVPGWGLPYPVEDIVAIPLLVAAALYLVLPFGAAFRAVDGQMAWYPFFDRFLPTTASPPVSAAVVERETPWR